MARKKTQEEAISEIMPNLKQGLSLEEFVYIDALTKGKVLCEKHGEKWILANKLKIGRGCNECADEKLSSIFRMRYSEVLQRFIKAHEYEYDYSKFVYVNNSTPGVITCRKHGDFLQAPEKHWSGRKCPKCSKESCVAWNKRSSIDTVTQANLAHNNRYLYLDPRGYENCKEHRDVTCIAHGIFSVTMDNHIGARSGCPQCSHKVSLAEVDLRNFVDSLGLVFEPNIVMPSRKHIDILIPSLNVGIEYNGIRWHRESLSKNRNYHLDKFKEAQSLGVSLVQVFEDELLLKKEIVLNCLKNKLGKAELNTYARNLEVVEVPRSQAAEFLSKTHLQGDTGSIVFSVGLISKGGSANDLQAIMCFTTKTKNCIELSRFSCIGRIPGAFSKLLKAARQYFTDKGFKYIVSFSDNRWSSGEVYLKNGFIFATDIPPDYYWCKGILRGHKRGFQRKYLSKKLKVFDSNLSESENCIANGYFKVWNAGLKKWSMKLDQP